MTLFWIFVAFFCLHEGWETFLEILNQRYIKKNQDNIPELFQSTITLPNYKKSIAYSLEKSRFGLMSSWTGSVFLWIFLLSGDFGVLDERLAMHFSGLSLSVAYCLAVTFIFTLIKMPFSIYSQFVIEEKYGFNRTTAAIFIIDLLKSLVLSLALGVPLLYLVFWLYQVAGSSWWIWAFATLFGFQFVIAAVYPTLLAPIFNKFTPLGEGTLKEKIESLAQKSVSKCQGFLRSTDPNAPPTQMLILPAWEKCAALFFSTLSLNNSLNPKSFPCSATKWDTTNSNMFKNK
ncbi:MAG: hypothetical protein IPJ69_06700 [Deltaproteobacteria bacterium]|nr:MAG: hypothetical protein IPJ69_06700 [Deltaproteobacteria bacterium]